MLPLHIAQATRVASHPQPSCGHLIFSFISGFLSGKLNVSPKLRGCISSRRASWTQDPQALLKLGRTFVCRTPSKRLPHWALLPFWQLAGALRPLLLKKRSSSLIPHRSHRSLCSTANTAKRPGALPAVWFGCAPLLRPLAMGAPC